MWDELRMNMVSCWEVLNMVFGLLENMFMMMWAANQIIQSKKLRNVGLASTSYVDSE